MKSDNIFRIILFVLLAAVTASVIFLLTTPPYGMIFWILFGFAIWGELLLCSLPLNFQNETFPVRTAILGSSVIIYAICLIIASICGALITDSKILFALELLILLIPGIGFCICSLAIRLQNSAIQSLTDSHRLFEKILQEASDIDFRMKNDEKLKDFSAEWSKLYDNLSFASKETYQAALSVTERLLSELQCLKAIVTEQDNVSMCRTLIAEISHISAERERLCKNGKN